LRGVRRSILIVNPKASRVTPELTERVAAELAKGGPVETCLTEGPGHAKELAAQAGNGIDAVYVYSGDGGFNEAVNGIRAGVPIGFVPGGATSVLPRALGLPRNPVACARRLAGSERTRRISLGVVNGRRFTFCAGVGLDAELVRAVDKLGRETGRRPSDLVFVLELSRILRGRGWRIPPILTVNGHGRAAFVVVSNCDPYTYAGPRAVHATPEARFELGIDAIGPRELHGRWEFARLVWSVGFRPRHHRSPGYLYVHDADRLEVVCDAPAPLQVDGEDLGDVTEAVLESERDALTVLV
jgi:diacylglycerol kinase family enzyme